MKKSFLVDELKELSFAQYIALTLVTGLAIFMVILFYGGFISSALCWLITIGRGDFEDRVAASLLAFIIGVLVQASFLS